jgi:DNA-binding transcriptional MerR regulator
MRIRQLSDLTGASRDTLRFYEKRGLIHAARRNNGYRDYADETVDLVGFIRTAQRLGFSLNEIGAHLPTLWRAADPDTAVAALLEEKIGMIDARLAELAALREDLTGRLAKTCPLGR